MAEENHAPASATIDPSVMELGKTQYNLCMGCHGPAGEGMPNIAPPLAGSEWVLGPAENLIRIQLRGLMGPIEVKGQEYNLVMAPMGAGQPDASVAAVITYIRNSWGNQGSEVTPEMVKALRGEEGKPMLTVADLIDPATVKTPASSAGQLAPEPLSALPSFSLQEELGVPTVGIVTTAVITILSLIAVIKMKFTN